MQGKITIICGEMDVRHTKVCVMFGGLNDFYKASKAGFRTG